QIAQSGLISVPSATATQIALPNVSLGDVSNGIEIQVDAQCGSVTTKNFYFTEWQLEEGSVVTSLDRRTYEQELRDCQRYFEVGGLNATQNLNTGVNTTITFPVPF